MKRIGIYIVTISLLFTGCDSFLDQEPKHQLTIDNAVNDYSSALNIVNGMYSKIQGNELGGGVFLDLSAQAGVYLDNDTWYNMDYRQGKNDNGTAWIQYYSGVNAANAAIYALSALDVSKYPSPKEKERLIAEARCFRAFMNTHLFWLWGHWWAEDSDECGLLYRDQVANLSNLPTARLNVGESYQKIFEDIEFAITNLSDYKDSRYLSKQMAQALKAKLLLYRGRTGDYQAALDVVEEIMGTAPAAFHIEPDLAKMYEDAWDSPEVLWTRYLEEKGGNSARTFSEYGYSGAICYNTSEFRDGVNAWITEDVRFSVTADSARSPEAWDTSRKKCLVKLYHGGRIDEPNAKYATYYFRYAELYLMKAELRARLNPADIAGALEPLNEMRGKRTNPVMPALTAANTEELMEVIFKEIINELLLENGSEYFASLRFMKDSKPMIYSLKPDVNVTVNKYCWPIPADEMKNNKLMVQNPDLE